MINVSRLAKRAHEKDVRTGNDRRSRSRAAKRSSSKNVRLAKSLIGDMPYYVLGPLVTDIASGYDHIASAIRAAYLAEDLKLVKIIRTITTYPQQARNIPIGVAITLLAAAKNILIAKGNHSKIKKVRAMVVPHHDYRADEEIEALVLVNGAIMALESAAAAAGGATTVDT